jgi:hypothetical protein
VGWDGMLAEKREIDLVNGCCKTAEEDECDLSGWPVGVWGVTLRS